MIDYLALLDRLPVWLVFALAGTSVLLETALLVGVVLPGTTAVLALGVISAVSPVPYWITASVGVVAAAGGGQVAFWSGRRTSETVLRRAVHRLSARRHVDVWELTREYGPYAIPVAQVTVGARTLAPRIAAAGRMPWRRYAAVALPSAVAWALGLVTTGHVAGSHAGSLAGNYAWGATAVVAVAVMAATGAWFVARRLGHGRAGAKPPGDASGR